MIDRGDIRPNVYDRCSNIWASLPGAGYGQFEHKADSLIAKFKARQERSERLMYEQVCDYLRSWFIIIVCLSWAVNHYRDNAITYKAQRDKNARELKLANAAITDMQMRQRDVAALVQNTKELADAKAENDALRDDVAAGRRRLRTSKQSVRQCVKATTASGVDNAASPTGRHRWTGLFHPQRRLITMQKQLEGTRKYINEQCR